MITIFRKNPICFTAYFAVAAFRLFYFENFSDSIDGILYLSIAEKYQNSFLHDAINGFWSPLLSWILAVLLPLKANPFFVFSLVNLAAGWVVLAVCVYFLEKSELSKTLKTILSLCFIPPLTLFSIEQTPDLLYVAIVSALLLILTHEKYPEKLIYPVLAGLAGGLLYLTKAFGLPMFIASFAFIHLYYFLQTKKRSVVVKNFVVGIISFGILSGIWIALLSNKYGELTVSTAKDYNLAVLNPKHVSNNDLEKNLNHLLVFNGLTTPLENSINAWEEPTKVENKPESWSRFSGRENFIHYLFIIKKNILAVFYNDLIRNCSLFFLVLFFYSLRKRFIFSEQEKKHLFVFGIVALTQTAGYVSVLVMERYLWIVPLLLIMGFAILLKKFEGNIFNKKYALLPAFVFLVIVSLTSFNESRAYLPSKEMSKKMELAAKKVSLTGNIAAVSENNISKTYHASLLLAYYERCKFFGNISSFDSSEIEKSIQQFRLEYLLVWNTEKELGLPLVFKDDEAKLKIYQCH